MGKSGFLEKIDDGWGFHIFLQCLFTFETPTSNADSVEYYKYMSERHKMQLNSPSVLLSEDAKQWKKNSLT